MRFSRVHLRAAFSLLALIEAALCILAVRAALDIRILVAGDIPSSTPVPPASDLLFGIVMSFMLMSMGLYQGRFRGGVRSTVLRAVIAFAAGVAFLSMIFYLIPEMRINRGVFVIAVGLAFSAVCMTHPLYIRYCVDHSLVKARILVLGAGEAAALIHRRLRRRSDRLGFSIAGYLPLPTDAESDVDGTLLVKPGNRPLAAYCHDQSIDRIVVAADDRRSALPMNEMLECRLEGVEIVDLLTFFEREQGKLVLDILRPDWLVFSKGFKRGLPRAVLKRSFDIVAGTALLVFTWPFMLLAMAAIKVEDGLRAPLLYRQVRVGYVGRPFEVLKLRSMSTDAEKDDVARWATPGDARVTRVGAVIRKTRIDELPQILNVLRGDMSFVGPRPERPQFVEQLVAEVPYYRERHGVKPGLTGWAQVCYPYGASVQDSARKQEFDLFYVKNHNMFLDLLILFRTAEVVLFGKGAR